MIIWHLKETDGVESEKEGIIKGWKMLCISQKRENNPHSIMAPSMRILEISRILEMSQGT